MKSCETFVFSMLSAMHRVTQTHMGRLWSRNRSRIFQDRCLDVRQITERSMDEQAAHKDTEAAEMPDASASA
jgi:hypothetical protein